MITLTGRPVISGKGSGAALFTDRAVNFTAAFTKPINLLPFKKSEFRDEHHPWFRQDIQGKVLLIPTCIGSTHTGLVILDLVKSGKGPAAIIIDKADSLLVSGVVMAEVWYGLTFPIVEYDTAALMRELPEGATVGVDGETGEIRF